MLGFAFAAITTAAIILASRAPATTAAIGHLHRRGGQPNGSPANAGGRDPRLWGSVHADRRSGPEPVA